VIFTSFADGSPLRLQFLDVDRVLRADKLGHLRSRDPLTDAIAEQLEQDSRPRCSLNCCGHGREAHAALLSGCSSGTFAGSGFFLGTAGGRGPPGAAPPRAGSGAGASPAQRDFEGSKFITTAPLPNVLNTLHPVVLPQVGSFPFNRQELREMMVGSLLAETPARCGFCV